MDLAILTIMVMAFELGLHYFPWMMLLRGRQLPRLVAYTIGMLGLMVPFSVWLWMRNEVHVLGVLWLVISAGGLTVFALYGFDHYIELIMRDIEASERESHVAQK